MWTTSELGGCTRAMRDCLALCVAALTFGCGAGTPAPSTTPEPALPSVPREGPIVGPWSEGDGPLPTRVTLPKTAHVHVSEKIAAEWPTIREELVALLAIE